VSRTPSLERGEGYLLPDPWSGDMKIRFCNSAENCQKCQMCKKRASKPIHINRPPTVGRPKAPKESLRIGSVGGKGSGPG
jgi:hypothetical protein